MNKLRLIILIALIISIIGSIFFINTYKPTTNTKNIKKEKILNKQLIKLKSSELNLKKDFNNLFENLELGKNFIKSRIIFSDFKNVNKGKNISIFFKGSEDFEDFKKASLALNKVQNIKFFEIDYIYKFNEGKAYTRIIYDRNISKDKFLLEKGLVIE